MDIGTAKPAGAERGRFALVDVADPGEAYSCGQIHEGRHRAMRRRLEGREATLRGRRHRPLYPRLLQGLAELPSIPESVRKQVETLPLEARVDELSRLDPETAAKPSLKIPGGSAGLWKC